MYVCMYAYIHTCSWFMYVCIYTYYSRVFKGFMNTRGWRTVGITYLSFSFYLFPHHFFFLFHFFFVFFLLFSLVPLRGPPRTRENHFPLSCRPLTTTTTTTTTTTISPRPLSFVCRDTYSIRPRPVKLHYIRVLRRTKGEEKDNDKRKESDTWGMAIPIGLPGIYVFCDSASRPHRTPRFLGHILSK